MEKQNKIDKIKEKIAKLKALASSDNENEAQSALLAMRSFMEKYDITEEMLRNLESDTAKVKETFWRKPNAANLKAWEIRLASAIARLFNSRIVISGEFVFGLRWKRNKVLFLGVEEDSTVAMEMYYWINDILWKASHDKAKEAEKEIQELIIDEDFKDVKYEDLPEELQWNTNRFVQSFLQGATSKIEDRVATTLEDRRAKYVTNETALLVLNKKLEKVQQTIDDMDTNSVSSGFNIADMAGFSEGQKKGDDINLTNQLNEKNDLGQGLLK